MLYVCFGASLVAQMVKNPSAMQGSWVRSLVRKISWRREWLPSPILLPEEFQGQRSLVAYTPLGCKELDMTEYADNHLQPGCINTHALSPLVISPLLAGRVNTVTHTEHPHRHTRSLSSLRLSVSYSTLYE